MSVCYFRPFVFICMLEEVRIEKTRSWYLKEVCLYCAVLYGCFVVHIYVNIILQSQMVGPTTTPLQDVVQV